MPYLSLLNDAEYAEPLALASLMRHLHLEDEVWILDVPHNRLGATRWEVQCEAKRQGLNVTTTCVPYAGGCDLLIARAERLHRAWPVVRFWRACTGWIRSRFSRS